MSEPFASLPMVTNYLINVAEYGLKPQIHKETDEHKKGVAFNNYLAMKDAVEFLEEHYGQPELTSNQAIVLDMLKKHYEMEELTPMDVIRKVFDLPVIYSDDASKKAYLSLETEDELVVIDAFVQWVRFITITGKEEMS